MQIDGQGAGDYGMGAPDATGDAEIDSLLGTSPTGETTGGLDLRSSGQGADLTQGAGDPYKFGGRTWKGGQREAEAAWNKIYGGYSERQGLVNALKSADPEVLSALASDPKMGQILSKLGIQAATEDFQDAGREQDGQMSMEELREEIMIDRQTNTIMREQWAFERKLGRSMNPAEETAVLRVIERAETLSYEEAYYLAHRSQIMKQQAQGAAASPVDQSAQGGRPKPPPRSMPGTPGPNRKHVKDMTEEEWKRNLKESGVIKELLSRGRG